MNRSIDWPHAPPHRLGSGHSYFVTAGTYRKQHHFRQPEHLDVLQRGLFKLCREYGWKLEAWAIFSNHYHFIALPSSADEAVSLRKIVTTLHSKTARWINKLDAKPSRKIWHNYRETILSYERSRFARLKYVHRNAVHHGLVRMAEDYPWCSASWFQRSADSAYRKTIESFKIDRVNVPDDFHPIEPATPLESGGKPPQSKA